jgi:hypothetical protein
LEFSHLPRRRKSVRPSAKARAMSSILMAVSPSIRNGPDKPCLKALRLELKRPRSVLGPVLSLALARLAAICFAVASNPFPTAHVMHPLFVRDEDLSRHAAGPRIGFVLIFFNCRR